DFDDSHTHLLKKSGHHQDVVADDPDRVGADAPLRLDRGRPGRELETPLMPRTVDVFEVADHDGITRHVLVHDGSAAGATGAQRPALMRAVVGDGVETAVDVVNTDTVT